MTIVLRHPYNKQIDQYTCQFVKRLNETNFKILGTESE